MHSYKPNQQKYAKLGQHDINVKFILNRKHNKETAAGQYKPKLNNDMIKIIGSGKRKATNR
jgi:hypothetical protein